MADMRSLEQRLEGISVQDENHESGNAPPAQQHKAKVRWLTKHSHLPLEPLSSRLAKPPQTPSAETPLQRNAKQTRPIDSHENHAPLLLTAIYFPLTTRLDLYKLSFLITVAVLSTIPW
ncbi:hypothetical protein KC331_g5635, partial [Hortaea werneckii]